MFFAAFVVLAQAPLTPTALVDQLTMRYGYGVIGTPVAVMDPVTVPDPANEAEVAARLRTRWRVVQDAAMPGVFRPEVAPYDDLFDEERFHRVRNGVAVIPPRLPDVTVAALARPGGVRLRVDQLVVLLQAQALQVPNVYRRRTVLVRIDPSRALDTLALFAAITGGVPSSDRRRLEFDPASYRRLAVATLSMEAQRTEFEGAVIRTGDRIAYWEQRPLRLAMGAAAFHAADDATLAGLARTPQRVLIVPVPRLAGQGTDIVRQLMESYTRNNTRPTFNVGDVEISGVPQIKVSGGSGLGRIGIPSGGATPTAFL